MSYGKSRRPGASGGQTGGPVQFRLAPGKRSPTADRYGASPTNAGSREAARRQEEAFHQGALSAGSAPEDRSLALRRAGEQPPPGRSDASQIAAAGVAGAPQVLPHADAIQRSFGSHEVAGIGAHVGGEAAQAADALGAEAFATGNDVAFRAAPDLYTVAHEAAHVVQQRGGVELKGGLGPADQAAEAHADGVADRVVDGQSAQDLLDEAPWLGTVALKKGKGKTADGEAKGKADDESNADGKAGDNGKADDTVTVTVKWGGVFGADLSAKVVLAGRNEDDKHWTTLETKDVVDPDAAEGDKSQRVEESFEVARYQYYRATVTPVDDVKGDAQDVGRLQRTLSTLPGGLDGSTR